MSSQEQPSLNKKRNPTTTDVIKAKESSNYNYYRLILLVCLFLFLSVLLYGSVLTATDVKKPLAVSGAEYDLYLNYTKGNSDPANSAVMLGATDSNPKVNFDKLKEFEIYRQCSENSDCVMNINSGYKRCPADKNTGLLYDVRNEICTKSSTCPQLTKFRFAVKKDGEALDGNCGPNNDRCRCVAKQQCATKVVSNFSSINGDVYAANTDGYAFQISNPKEHAYDNVIFEDVEANSEFCKLNPAYTDKIINGCDFQNSVGDPLDCLNTQDVYFQPYNITFKFAGVIAIDGSFYGSLNTVDEYSQLYSVGAQTIFLEYPEEDFIDNNNFEFYFIFESKDSNDKYIIKTFKPDTNGSLHPDSINNANTGGIGIWADYPTIPSEGNILLIMDNISYYDSTHNGWVSGAPSDLILTAGDICHLSSLVSNRCNPGDFGANFKNMLNCVQNSNQPCVGSNLGYNVDNIGLAERGPFCRYDTNNDRNDFTSDKYYIKDVSYYTLSCLIGKGCGKELDTSFSTEESIKIKKSKLFPTTDMDAVSNVWFLTNFGNSLNITTGTGNVSFNNSFLELNIGDYWLEGKAGNTFLTCKSNIDGPSNKIELFENPHFNGVSTGKLVTVNSGISVGDNVSITELFPSASYPNINGLSFNKTTGISFRSGNEVTIYNAKDSSLVNYGTVGKNNILYNNNNVFSGEMSEVTIFKQFGFNGINYNTFYDIKNNKRYYSDSYQYYKYFADQQPGFPKNPDRNLFLASPPISLNQISSLEPSGGNRSDPQSATMLDYTANFKIEKNMYYPTWDPNKFQQICQMCQPTFINFTQINTDQTIGGCTIQFSSADFKNYAYGFDKQAGSNYSSYYYTTFLSVGISGGRDDLTSNTSLLVFNEDITKYGISVGDYIIDEEGFYGKNLVYHGTQYSALSNLGNPLTNSMIKIMDQKSIKSDQYLLDDRFVPYNIEGTSYSYNSFNLRSSTDQITFDIDDSTGKIPNIFAGKFYTYKDVNNNYQLFTVQPQITIRNIITNPQQTGGLTLVETTSPVTENLKENSLLQFISKDKKLGLCVARNYEDNAKNNPLANNAEIIVNGITQGRITDLKITNPGSNYLNIKKPVVLINEYNIFDVSKRILF